MIAEEEKPPVSPKSERFKVWVNEVGWIVAGNEINPPELDDAL